MPRTVSLIKETPYAIGDHKAVYVHPENSGLLIKICHQAGMEDLKQRYPIAMKYQRLPKYWEILHEIVEHLAVREQITPENSHLETVVGLVDTDLGMGMVVEAIRTKDGNIAPSLNTIVKNGEFNSQYQAAFDEIMSWVSKTNTILRELKTSNLVWDQQHAKFIIIDGIGSKPIFSLRQHSRRYNTRSNIKRVATLRERLAKEINICSIS